MKNRRFAKFCQFVSVLLTILAPRAPGEVKSGILSEFVDSAAGLPARAKLTRTIKLGGNLSFGEVPVLRKRTRQLKITNTGNSPLKARHFLFEGNIGIGS